MIFAAHQPNLMPYVGFWHKADVCDVFGLMASVQFVRREYQNRVKIGTDDDSRWFTVPVKAEYKCEINSVYLSDEYSGDKLLKTLLHAYGKYPYWDRYGPLVGSVFRKFGPGDKMLDLNARLLGELRCMLNIKTKFKYLPPKNKDASSNAAAWTKDAGGDVYLSGGGGRNYLDETPFIKCGMSVEYVDLEIMEGFKTVSVLTALMRFGSGWRTVIL